MPHLMDMTGRKRKKSSRAKQRNPRLKRWQNRRLRKQLLPNRPSSKPNRCQRLRLKQNLKSKTTTTRSRWNSPSPPSSHYQKKASKETRKQVNKVHEPCLPVFLYT